MINPFSTTTSACSRSLLPVLCAGLLLLAGCTDLVQTNPNQETTSTFFESQEDALRALNATYNRLASFNGTYGQWPFFYRDQRTDISYSNSPWTALSNLSKFTFTSYNFAVVSQAWDGYYQVISRANRVIANVPEIDMNEPLRARYVAEAKFVRALAYYNLVSLYDDVPMPLEPVAANARPEQRPSEDVWAQIEQDLQDAQSVLPSKGGYSTDNQGRATSGAATALLARAHLQQREWNDAASAFEQVVGSGDYGLLDTYIENFDADDENHEESVFAIQFADDSRSSDNLAGHKGPKLYGPRQIAFADGQPTQWYFDQFMKEQTEDGNVDPRLEATIFYNREGGFEIFGTSYDALYGDTNEDGSKNQELFWKKYTEYYKNEQKFVNPINLQVIRYGGVLLEYADALNEAGQTSEAYAPIDRVRERANLSPLSDVKSNLSQDEMREQIEHEILLETGGEGGRWRYMMRHELWSQETQQLVAHDSEFSEYEDGRNYLPIPQTEVDLNPNIEQNPSY
jgi:hypothetical protein